jgi:hypothetical protein
VTEPVTNYRQTVPVNREMEIRFIPEVGGLHRHSERMAT